MKKKCVLNFKKMRNDTSSQKIDEHDKRIDINGKKVFPKNVKRADTWNEILIGAKHANNKNDNYIPHLTDKKITSLANAEVDYWIGKNINYKTKNGKIRGIRTDAVKSVNLIVSGSPQFFYDERNGETLGDILDNKEKMEHLHKWKEQSVQWLKDEFGDKLINAQLHLDETTPHIHCKIIPAVKCKNGQMKLSSKEFLSRKELKSYWDKYAVAMKDLGLERGDNSSIKQNKAKTRKSIRVLQAENEELVDTRASMNKELEEINQEYNHIDLSKKVLSEEKETLTEENKTLSEENETLSEEKETLTEENKTLSEENETLSEEKETLTEEKKVLSEDIKAEKSILKHNIQQMNTVRSNYDYYDTETKEMGKKHTKAKEKLDKIEDIITQKTYNGVSIIEENIKAEKEKMEKEQKVLNEKIVNQEEIIKGLASEETKKKRILNLYLGH